MTIINKLKTVKQDIIKDEGFWSPDAPAQIDKLIRSIETNGAKFTVKDSYSVERIEGVGQVIKEGETCKIDVDKLTKYVGAYIESWSVPTLDGNEVDIGLIG